MIKLLAVMAFIRRRRTHTRRESGPQGTGPTPLPRIRWYS
jgi:hypothetical protein